MPNAFQLMPTLEGDEMNFVQSLINEMSDAQAQQFALTFSSRRKDPQVILLLSLLGFIGLAGVQRFILDQIGIGLLYLFTAGLCFIGTIVDVVTYKKLAFEFNTRVAQQVAIMVKAAN